MRIVPALLVVVLLAGCSSGGDAPLGAPAPQGQSEESSGESSGGSSGESSGDSTGSGSAEPEAHDGHPATAASEGLAGTGAHQGHSADGAGEKRSRAARLVAGTRRTLGRYSDVADAEADGFRSLGDDGDRYVHYVDPSRMLDAAVLKPRHVESLVYETTDDGPRLVSAMYVLPLGTSLDEVPNLGDPRVQWHTHDDLCFSTLGTLEGHVVDGECQPGGINLRTPPMLHVWVVRHACGPFAGLGEGPGRCRHDH